MPLPFSLGKSVSDGFTVRAYEGRLKDVDVSTVGISFSVNL